MVNKVLLIGAVIPGFCNGYFGRDSHEDKRVEMVGADWVVCRDENGNVHFATGTDIIEKIVDYLDETYHKKKYDTFSIGDVVYSPFFGKDITIWGIRSDDDWWFNMDGQTVVAQTPLSYFAQRPELYRKVSKLGIDKVYRI